MLIGIIGKPSVGKSTFFKAATLAEVEIASYPFTTIKANHGVGYIKVECIDKEFGVQCNPNHGFCINNWRFVPVDLMHVAGLVPGASEGKGLGNQFLDELSQADAFIHILDVSGTTDVEGKPAKDYDPCEDVIFLEEELDKWYYNIFMRVWRGFARKTEHEDISFSEAVAKQFSGLKVNENQVKGVLRKLSFSNKSSMWDNEQVMKFATELRKLSKPMFIAANKSDFPEAKKNIEKMQKQFPDLLIYPCSSDSELALRQAAKAELIEYLPSSKQFKILKDLTDGQKQALDKIKENVLNVYGGTGVQEVLNLAVFDLLDYIAVFPVDNVNKLTDSKGNILPDCFLMPKGSTALDFAYHLHTDFGNNFIKAVDAKTKQARGKDYELRHRDVLEIVTGGGK